MLLVVSCTAGAVWWTTSIDHRVTVLALARPVTVGQVLSRADLRSTEVSATEDVATVAAEHVDQVLGRRMATSLAPGALLTPSSMGEPVIPTPGRSVAAFGLQPGQYPPEATRGTPVTVLVTAGSATGTAALDNAPQQPGTSWHATVVGINPADGEHTTVLSVEMDADAAADVAQVPAEQIALVMRSVGGER